MGKFSGSTNDCMEVVVQCPFSKGSIFHQYYTHSDLLSIFKSSTTHWYVTRRKSVKRLSKNIKFLIPELQEQLMSPERKKAIQKKTVDLVENLEIKELLNILTAKEVLRKRQLSDISALTTREEKVEKLLDIISRKSNNTYDVFCDALKDTEQCELIPKEG